MNDRFKFRYWDTATGNWEHKFHYFQLEPQNSNVIGCTILPLDRPNRYIIQQFTGLLDKNGKEIYEGDIVKHLPENSATDDMPFQIKYGKYNCPFGEGYIGDIEFGFFAETFRLGYVRSIALSEKLEIIGNIFENKELLEKR